MRRAPSGSLPKPGKSRAFRKAGCPCENLRPRRRSRASAGVTGACQKPEEDVLARTAASPKPRRRARPEEPLCRFLPEEYRRGIPRIRGHAAENAPHPGGKTAPSECFAQRIRRAEDGFPFAGRLHASCDIHSHVMQFAFSRQGRRNTSSFTCISSAPAVNKRASPMPCKNDSITIFNYYICGNRPSRMAFDFCNKESQE